MQERKQERNSRQGSTVELHLQLGELQWALCHGCRSVWGRPDSQQNKCSPGARLPGSGCDRNLSHSFANGQSKLGRGPDRINEVPRASTSHMIKVAIALSIGVGALITLSNWYSLYLKLTTERDVSYAPLLGGLLLVLGLVGMPETRPYAWLGVVADYGTIGFILALPHLVREAWSTSSINLVHRFVSDGGGRLDDFHLFKRGQFTIKMEHQPPIPCNEYGALIATQGLCGSWRSDAQGFVLEGYDRGRVLRVIESGDVYKTKEENYPDDKKFQVDRLDSLELRKVK